ncbi:DUF6776 family protein [Haliea sp. E17]|uniref:DUF6776 family protein n=1 Tax=Haliea sp. E17 TaxID=3401576 RepID=UPI003AAD2AED
MLARISQFVVDQVPQRSLRLLLLTSGLVAMLLLAGAFYLGEQAAYSGLGIDPERYHALEDEVPLLQERIAGLESELNMERTRASVDAGALEMVRKDLASQQEEIASLEEGLRFYRSLMSPGEIAQGLSLRPLELVAMEGDGQYAYRIVAQQEARKHAMLNGRLKVEILGMQDGEEIGYPLSALSADVEGETIALNFRYFQSIEGTLTLPGGFAPTAVSVEASASQPRAMESREIFPWAPKDKFSNVGL